MRAAGSSLEVLTFFNVVEEGAHLHARWRACPRRGGGLRAVVVGKGAARQVEQGSTLTSPCPVGRWVAPRRPHDDALEVIRVKREKEVLIQM